MNIITLYIYMIIMEILINLEKVKRIKPSMQPS